MHSTEDRTDTRPTVLIGPFNRRRPGGVAAVHEQFLQGLASEFHFVPHDADRSAGSTRPGVITAVNLFFAVRDIVTWIGRLLRHRPAIAHYAITSLWNAEKSLFMLFLARLLGARTVAHLHGGAFLDFWQGVGPLRGRLLRSGVNSLDVIVVLSEGWRQRVVRTLGIDPERVRVVPNPVDAGFEEAARAMPLIREGVGILALGALSRLKGSLDLLEAIARLRDTVPLHLVIAGPDREPGIRERLLHTIEIHRLGPLVELRASAFGAEKSGLFREASLFVLPSYVENLPVVVLEAAASGLPIVATPVGALPEYFRDGESIRFVPPGDVGQLAEALGELIGNPDRRKELGAGARRVFQARFAHRDIMKQMEAVYSTLLDPTLHRRKTPSPGSR